MSIIELSAAAKSASIRLAAIKTDVKNNALAEIAKALKQRSNDIILANRKDLTAAEENNLSAPLLKRLKFDEDKIADVCAGIDSLIKLEDPRRQTQHRNKKAARPKTPRRRCNSKRYCLH